MPQTTRFHLDRTYRRQARGLAAINHDHRCVPSKQQADGQLCGRMMVERQSLERLGIAGPAERIR
jgi:hypothetical protein